MEKMGIENTADLDAQESLWTNENHILPNICPARTANVAETYRTTSDEKSRTHHPELRLRLKYTIRKLMGRKRTQ